jgi:uracil phosphoribosyltransferase
MDLRAVTRTNRAAWYEIARERGSEDGRAAVTEYVVSTPESSEILNRPEIAGHAYTAMLGRAMTSALATAPFRSDLERASQHKVCVLHVLRGGLSFGLREALHDALGLNDHTSAFLSSQRHRDADGWHILEDQYRKLDLPQDAVVLIGDVVATGSTTQHALEVIARQLARTQRRLSHLFLFTIGCRHAAKVLQASLGRRATIVYLEGRFTLVGEEHGLRIGLPGTDLIRKDAVMAPEFAASQDESFVYPLERCVIYDAGSRAFDVPTYVEDVVGYWRELGRLAEKGFTLEEALAERWRTPHPKAEGRMVDAAALREVCEARIRALTERDV